jgi:hypothetical protein
MKKLLAVTLLLSLFIGAFANPPSGAFANPPSGPFTNPSTSSFAHLLTGTFARPPKQEYYSIRIYQLKNSDQETRVEKFLQTAFVPAMHRLGFSGIGVFKPIGNDTAAIRKIYVLIPAKTMEQLATLPQTLEKDAQYQTDGRDYLDATWDNPPYLRMESILLQAFPDMPRHAVPTPSRAHATSVSMNCAATKDPQKNISPTRSGCSIRAERSLSSGASASTQSSTPPFLTAPICPTSCT